MPKLKTSKKGQKPGMPLHKFIATGGKPKDCEGAKGVDSTTIPGYKERGESSK